MWNMLKPDALHVAQQSSTKALQEYLAALMSQTTRRNTQQQNYSSPISAEPGNGVGLSTPPDSHGEGQRSKKRK